MQAKLTPSLRYPLKNFTLKHGGEVLGFMKEQGNSQEWNEWILQSVSQLQPNSFFDKDTLFALIEEYTAKPHTLGRTLPKTNKLTSTPFHSWQKALDTYTTTSSLLFNFSDGSVAHQFGVVRDSTGGFWFQDPHFLCAYFPDQNKFADFFSEYCKKYYPTSKEQQTLAYSALEKPLPTTFLKRENTFTLSNKTSSVQKPNVPESKRRPPPKPRKPN